VSDKKVFTLTKWYFVMGDNRWGSTDSRACFGYQCYTNSNYEVTNEYILGKVILRLFPSPQTFSSHTL
jgi:hypothetical protein